MMGDSDRAGLALVGEVCSTMIERLGTGEEVLMGDSVGL